MSPRILLASAWTVVILMLCLFPSHWLPVAEQAMYSSHFGLPSDKMIHMGMFAALGLLWMRVKPTWGWTAQVLFGGLALALLTELGQGLPMIGRDPDTLDAFADAAGVIVGIGSYWAWRGLAAAAPSEELERAATTES